MAYTCYSIYAVAHKNSKYATGWTNVVVKELSKPKRRGVTLV